MLHSIRVLFYTVENSRNILRCKLFKLLLALKSHALDLVFAYTPERLKLNCDISVVML